MHFDVRTILYCTQMGPNASHVFRWAYTLAKHLDARIHVLYVIEGLTAKQRELVEQYSGQATLSRVIDEAEAEAASRLPKRIETFFRRYAPEDDWKAHVGEILVSHGHATDEILRHADETGAELIVVGAHRRTSLIETFIGSTARRLTERSAVPVLVVRVPEGRQELTIDDE